MPSKFFPIHDAPVKSHARAAQNAIVGSLNLARRGLVSTVHWCSEGLMELGLRVPACRQGGDIPLARSLLLSTRHLETLSLADAAARSCV